MLRRRTGVARSRALVIATTVCLGAGLVSAAAPASARARVVTLAGTNTITLSAAAASMDVDLPETVAAKGRCIGSTQVKVTGTADAVVVMLVPHEVTDYAQPLVFGRLPHREGADTFFSNCIPNETSQYLVAGRYRLYALRTAGTATVTFKLWSMVGSRRLSPRLVPGAVMKDLPVLQPYDATANVASYVASYGATARLSSAGFVWVVGWNRVSEQAKEAERSCTLGGSAATTLPLAVLMAPGCPLASSQFLRTRLAQPGENLWSGGRVGYGADTYAAGYSVTTHAPVTDAGALGIWMPA